MKRVKDEGAGGPGNALPHHAIAIEVTTLRSFVDRDRHGVACDLGRREPPGHPNGKPEVELRPPRRIGENDLHDPVVAVVVAVQVLVDNILGEQTRDERVGGRWHDGAGPAGTDEEW